MLKMEGGRNWSNFFFLLWCFSFCREGEKKNGLGLVQFAHVLNVRFFEGMRGAGIERTIESYIWREGWQLVCRDLGSGQTVDMWVVHRGLDNYRKKRKGAVHLGTAKQAAPFCWLEGLKQLTTRSHLEMATCSREEVRRRFLNHIWGGILEKGAIFQSL